MNGAHPFSRAPQMQELIKTELAYLKDLNTLCDIFLEPMLKSKLKREDAEVIFSNCTVLRGIHQSLAEEIKPCSAAADARGIADVYTRYAPFFKAYSEYCSGFLQSQRQLEALRASFHPKLEMALSVAEQTAGQGLASFLIKPVQVSSAN